MVGGGLLIANAVLRSTCPSQYVPLEATCTSPWGSPYTARFLATFAEFAFYRQVVQSLCLNTLWSYSIAAPSLFWLWVIGETLSWGGIFSQKPIVNFMEDAVWATWFILAFALSSSWTRYLLIPVIAGYAYHIPRMWSRLEDDAQIVEERRRCDTTSTATADGPYYDGAGCDEHERNPRTADGVPLVAQLSESGYWVELSTLLQLIMYIILVGVMVLLPPTCVVRPRTPTDL